VYDGAYWGRFMPLQDTGPSEIDAVARRLEAGESVESVIDGTFAAPLFHDLTHGMRTRIPIFPPHIDECCAVYFGVRAAPDLMLSTAATANALQSTSWYFQLGQVLARTVGADALIRAYVGTVAWSAVLRPELLRALSHLAWEDYAADRESSFLSRAYAPDAYAKLFYLSAAGRTIAASSAASLDALPWADVPAGEEQSLDGGALRDGIRAMCVAHFRDGDCVHVGSRVPRAPVTIDLETLRIRTEPTPGGCDPAPEPAYLFPPPIARRLRASGVRGYSLRLESLVGIDDATDAIGAGAATHSTLDYSLDRIET